MIRFQHCRLLLLLCLFYIVIGSEEAEVADELAPDDSALANVKNLSDPPE